MESIGAIAEGEWSYLSGMYTSEEADFMAQLLVNCPLNQIDSSSSFGVPSSFWPNHESTMNMEGLNECLLYSSDIADNNLYQLSQVSSGYSGGGGSILFPNSSGESYYMSDCHPVLANTNSSMSTDFCMGNSYVVDGDDCSNPEMSNGTVEESGGNQTVAVRPEPESNLQSKRESEMPASEAPLEDKSSKPPENSKKRSRSSGDAQKNKRKVRSKKRQKVASTSNNDEESNGGLDGPVSSGWCSGDESNASRELNGGASSSSKGTATLNSSGKTRASRGAATDPQSLYARKRRERINERLRILQNLVPNGTKVDISTMLEEAVQYVKFLQLQIKLLSSDDLWMYAPIAYNGMDIGLDHLRC
ncbi:hypothetical protein SADUNF_Sadunf16G0177400 [Salix dunnii]|uniref:BHLH domain-containing protein n=1 Tax=Salix dunnii TaxID=1413687 RepID=A0A835J956_9ROSI|nr:hypothetical protein SADUNF_Sadunf16G0177400 [Salix dunnii]